MDGSIRNRFYVAPNSLTGNHSRKVQWATGKKWKHVIEFDIASEAAAWISLSRMYKINVATIACPLWCHWMSLASATSEDVVVPSWTAMIRCDLKHWRTPQKRHSMTAKVSTNIPVLQFNIICTSSYYIVICAYHIIIYIYIGNRKYMQISNTSIQYN